MNARPSTPRSRDRSRRRPPHDERGLSESVQWSILMPLVMLAILGLVQAGIVLHGRTVAANAALAGAEAEALAGRGGVAGQVAREVAEEGGLRDVDVHVTPGRDVLVRVDGRVDSFFPGRSRVSARAAMPKEQT